MQLVIVESPAKAKTIEKYLGRDYRVLASYGHVRDLPPKDGSVEPDADFKMHWEVSADRSKQLRAIADEAKKADRVVFATDPDREGEAISWHLYEYLKAKKALPADTQRVAFNEITKTAILKAMDHPRAIDQELVDAYLARRALDYLVGFTLSPVLWRKLPGAKSAGRVQSVALRLIVDREREIELFRNREYWTVEGDFAANDGRPFVARLVEWQGKKLDKFDLNAAALANEAKADVLAGDYRVSAVETKPVTRNPYPPFTTSTLQQEAARKLGMTATQTMRTAQQLYEQGAITYMRTDGVSIAGEAITQARDVIAQRFGANHLPDKPRIYQSKAKNAQEAHEAIRPTDLSLAPDRASLSGEHARLYELIWKRTLASQMASARMERTAVDLVDANRRATLRATGQVILFPGFLALYTETQDDVADGGEEDGQRLPKLTQGDTPKLSAARAEQHFTQPPPRFSEASLVKRLEELGIGRPSTYASILQTLRDRAYVRVEKARFHPEESGRLVTAFLERFFEKYVGYDFTAGLEDQLDGISAGDLEWKVVLRAFWEDFKPKTVEITELKPSEVTQALDEFLAPYLFPDTGDGDPRTCPSCGNGRLSLRGGKFGAFVACSNYPECRYTRQFGGSGEAAAANDGPSELGKDPETGEPISLRSGRFGQYVQRGDGEKPPRASIPKDVAIDSVDLELALRLLSLPRTVGTHPETGLPILASIGKYGPYLMHDGKYARLGSTTEVFETGMNAAVVKLAEPRGERRGPKALRELGAHPVSGGEIRLMEGRYGNYVTDGTTNATLPKTANAETLTLEEAAALIDARAAAGPSKGKKPARKVPPKKAAAKKPAAKRVAKKVLAKG